MEPFKHLNLPKVIQNARKFQSEIVKCSEIHQNVHYPKFNVKKLETYCKLVSIIVSKVSCFVSILASSSLGLVSIFSSKSRSRITLMYRLSLEDFGPDSGSVHMNASKDDSNSKQWSNFKTVILHSFDVIIMLEITGIKPV